MYVASGINYIINGTCHCAVAPLLLLQVVFAVDRSNQSTAFCCTLWAVSNCERRCFSLESLPYCPTLSDFDLPSCSRSIVALVKSFLDWLNYLPVQLSPNQEPILPNCSLSDSLLLGKLSVLGFKFLVLNKSTQEKKFYVRRPKQ